MREEVAMKINLPESRVQVRNAGDNDSIVLGFTNFIHILYKWWPRKTKV